MKSKAVLAVSTTLVALASALPAHAEAPPAADPYAWLEAVNDDKALEFVKTANARSLAELTGRPGYAKLYDRLLGIYDAKERIPYVSQMGDQLYNFWRDDKHIRGIWRRTSWAEYRKPAPQWQVVLDLDQLATQEGENWVWKSAACLFPKYDRCLVKLSRGGGDATVTREFDPATGTFVKDGFYLPEAKGELTWIDRDTVLAATDFGPGTMTESGYPRIVKSWTRGTPLTAAIPVYEGKASDVRVDGSKEFAPGFEREFIQRAMTFWTNEVFLRRAGNLIRIDKPDDADMETFRDQILLTLRSEWKVGGKTHPAGALLATDFEDFLKGSRDFHVLFAPTERVSLAGVTDTRNKLFVSVLDNVKSRIYEFSRPAAAWQQREVALPGIGTASVNAVDAKHGDDYFLNFNDFLTPATLSLVKSGQGAQEKLKTAPSFFAVAGLKVDQLTATSRDGTKIPYFLVAGAKIVRNGQNPTLLYGYGGFEIPLTPGYSGSVGAGWLETGGVYVIANIRGGGEFGPTWHQAALKANRQHAYDDFIAVAEDLQARKITSPQHLAIEGGSNGGLLVGAVMVQRPELFQAVVCQVPLLDMRRYHKLLAGASWVGEYGNPDDPAQWAFISKYSPYQNVVKGKKYPRVLFITSTRDDRVHPGHARKMYAKMQDQGHDVLYFENTEGGHAGAANNQQQAKMWALTYIFLQNQLGTVPAIPVGR